MRAPELLAELSNKGIKVWAEGDRLRFRAPEGALTGDLREALVNKKEEILALLRDAETGTASADIPMAPVPRDGRLALSFAQQRMWFLARLQPDLTAYNVAWAVRLQGVLEILRIVAPFSKRQVEFLSLLANFHLLPGQRAHASL